MTEEEEQGSHQVTVGQEAGETEEEEVTTTTLAAVVDNDGITYTYVPVQEQDIVEAGVKRKEDQVEGDKTTDVAMAEIAVTTGEEGEEDREAKQAASMTMTTTLLVDDPPPLYLLQSHPEYKWDLLHSMLDLDTSGCALDFPVFCGDGVAWSSRLLLAAMSPMLKEALSGAEQGTGESCLVLPDVTRAEFTTFSRALFAQKGDKSLDFLVLIKIAETLGAHIVSKTNALTEAFERCFTGIFSFL